MQAAGGSDCLGAGGFQVAGDRALGAFGVVGDVAEAALAFGFGPVVQLVEEAARVRSGAGGGDRADDAAGCGDAGEQAEAGAGIVFGDVGDADRVAQVGLVGAEFQHRLVVGDAREGRLGHRSAVGEFLEHAGDDGFDGVEDVFLGDVAHFEVELVELARGAVGAGGFVAEAGRDLEIAVEAGHHQQLLELLRRLRQGVELAGMQAGGHQEVAGAFRGRGGQDRGLIFQEALLDHAPADRGDDLAAQHHVAVQLVAAQVDEAVFEADVLGEAFVAGDLHGQHLGGGLHHKVGDAKLDLAGGQAGVDGAGFARDHGAGDGDDAFRAHRVGGGEGGGAGGEDALGDAVMVPQVDEQQAAVVALGMHPAREARFLAGVGGAEGATGMGAIGVHGPGILPKTIVRVSGCVRGGTQALSGWPSQAFSGFLGRSTTGFVIPENA